MQNFTDIFNRVENRKNVLWKQKGGMVKNVGGGGKVMGNINFGNDTAYS
jgi:hypothetical protein